MSKKNREHHYTPPPTVGPHLVALKPQRKILVILSIIFALWVGLLLTLYFTTVYPVQHQRAVPSGVDKSK
jgi:hypothetical protein